jgi:ABC-type sugar transport system ATPase subunit
VFLLDEPLSHLDAALRVRMRSEIARLHRRLGATILYVTHDHVEAMTLGNRIVVMQSGRVQQVDSPRNIYERPANQFVASYSGSPPMNFFVGEVREGVFRLGDCRLDVRSAVQNGPATLGVRPEDLLPGADSASLGSVTLDLVESAGHDTIGHFELSGSRHTVHLPPGESLQSGDRLQLSIRPGRFHLFAEDGRRLN